jgi:hypothetical protein
MRIAMDTGGTFTDCVFLRNGKLEIVKVPSQPKNPAAAIGAALSVVREKLGTAVREDLDLVCGTTVGTNALLERSGGRVLLITTAGFEDVLEIGRQARPSLYDLKFQKTPPLVPRERIIGAPERLAVDGSVLRNLSAAEIQSLVQSSRRTRPDAVAVCFLFSFRSAKHEALVAKALRHQGFQVSVSHEIWPELREFLRVPRSCDELVPEGNKNSRQPRMELLGRFQIEASRASPCDAVQWRDYFCGKCGRAAGSNRSLWACGGRDGRRVRGIACGARKSDYVRHGRDFDGCGVAFRRDANHNRVERRRSSDFGADA